MQTAQKEVSAGIAPISAHDGGATLFDVTTAVTETSTPGAFEVELSPAWESLVGVHGGSRVAVAVHGAERLVPGRSVRTVHSTFFRAAVPGPAQLIADVTHESRSVSAVSAVLEQNGRPVMVSHLTLMTARAGVEWFEIAPLLAVAVEDCVPIVPRQPSPHFRQVEAVLDPSSLPFTDGPRAVVRGYLRPVERRPIDPAWLAMASDWFPPPAFVRVEPPTGGVSVDLVTHVHRTWPTLESGEWLTAEFSIDTSAAGLAVEHGRIATVGGLLLAESFQTRWTAEA